MSGPTRGRVDGAPDATGLAEAKLAAPVLRGGILVRPRIVRALDAPEATRLTLVAAPPGYGKTTAVRYWCAIGGRPFAWVTVDARDRDPSRFWRYVATAVDRLRPGLGANALRSLLVTGAPVESAIDDLVNEIASWGAELTLVLDDLQTVTDLDCLASLDYLLERLPVNARVVVITRVDPSLRLANLRARGELTELRAAELAFTGAEARELVLGFGRLGLNDAEIDVLLARTEGWPAGLILAALWLRSVEDPGIAVRRFGADQQFIAEYLSQEVLSSLADDTRDFLLRASVLGKFTSQLCDECLGRSDSASLLDEIERSMLLITRLGQGGWRRVHSLFADYARLQLASSDPDAAATIHRRAAGWLRSQGLGLEAVEHAAAANDQRLVAEILVEQHLSLLRHGGAGALLGWIRTLSDDRLVEHPELAVAGAAAATMVGHRALERRRLLGLVARTRAEQPRRLSDYVDAAAGTVIAASVDTDVQHALRSGRRAVTVARAGSHDMLVSALAGYARALYLAGECDQAWKTAMRAIEQPEAEHHGAAHAFARCTLALAALDQGRHEAARGHAEKARELIGGAGGSRTWPGADASAAVGCVLLAEDNLADAERELGQAQRFFSDEVATVYHTWLLALLARARCRRGRLEDAKATLALAREAVLELSDGGRVTPLIDDVQTELERANARAADRTIVEPPSHAELTVLELLASDLSTRQIGATLFLSPNTVRSHTRALYRKLGVSSRADAVARATAAGLLAGSSTDAVPLRRSG